MIRPFVHATLNLTQIAQILKSDRCEALYARQSREWFGAGRVTYRSRTEQVAHRNATSAILRDGRHIAPRRASSPDLSGRLPNDTPHGLGTDSRIGSQPRELEHMRGNGVRLREERFLLHVGMPDGRGGCSL